MVPGDWLPDLRACFESGVQAADAWPVPRGADWRHALVDLDARVQAVCRLPTLLAAVRSLICGRFFIAQVEGRDPRPGGGHQGLHRDLTEQCPGDTVNALVFLDDYAAHNGATRLVPGSHRAAPGGDLPVDESSAVQLCGLAGDALVFDADLLHAVSCNLEGSPRRTLLICYFAEHREPGHLASARLRSVRMDTRERFER